MHIYTYTDQNMYILLMASISLILVMLITLRKMP